MATGKFLFTHSLSFTRQLFNSAPAPPPQLLLALPVLLLKVSHCWHHSPDMKHSWIQCWGQDLRCTWEQFCCYLQSPALLFRKLPCTAVVWRARASQLLGVWMQSRKRVWLCSEFKLWLPCCVAASPSSVPLPCNGLGELNPVQAVPVLLRHSLGLALAGATRHCTLPELRDVSRVLALRGTYFCRDNFMALKICCTSDPPGLRGPRVTLYVGKGRKEHKATLTCSWQDWSQGSGKGAQAPQDPHDSSLLAGRACASRDITQCGGCAWGRESMQGKALL